MSNTSTQARKDQIQPFRIHEQCWQIETKVATQNTTLESKKNSSGLFNHIVAHGNI